jgi:hypothetical protein
VKYFYADQQTKEFLQSNAERVYLYGGSGGFSNFGDIIQLKGTILFHHQRTALAPVLVMFISSLEHSTYVSTLKHWYGCDHIIFVSNNLINATKSGLSLISAIAPGGLLHVYGGGFLNKYWGETMIENVRSFMDLFDIADYVVSGQQIDKDSVDVIHERLLSKKEPILFGVRDRESLKHMKKVLTGPLEFSFDDVTEIFDAWVRKSKLSFRLRLINRLRSKAVLLHMNSSYYAVADKSKLLVKIRDIRKLFPGNRMIVLQSYNDSRLSTSDSLQTLVQLGDSFPYTDYKVCNLALMALKINAKQGSYPNLVGLFGSAELCVAASYHTAMLAAFFSIPSHLMSENEYYAQKQKGLLLEPNFEKFLKDPSKSRPKYDDELKSRKNWINKLESSIKEKDMFMKDEVIKVQETLAEEEAPEIKYKNTNS